MSRSVDVAVIGAGSAGLATSWHLTQANIEHVVLDAGRVGETWRTRRWDSFCLVTPNWSVQLPGAKYSGPDPHGYMPLANLVAHLQSWAASFQAPFQGDSRVESLEQGDGGFVLSLPGGKLRARSVVVATGAFQRAHRPAGAEEIPAGVTQLLAEEYRKPDSLQPGAVLIVGSGQTGCQLAEELHEAGRTVYLACGRCPWTPRRIQGRDFVLWSAESGFLDRRLPAPAARLVGNVQSTGHGGGHDMHYRTLHAQGVELLGRYAGAEGSTVHFADDLAASVDFGDARLRDMWKHIEGYCTSTGRPVPEFEWPEPFRVKTRTELDVVKQGIGAVIWTSGYRPDYRWVKIPVFDEVGFPVQTDGRTGVPGLYFVGLPWLRKFKSSILYGVGEDAELVAQHIDAARS